MDRPEGPTRPHLALVPPLSTAVRPSEARTEALGADVPDRPSAVSEVALTPTEAPRHASDTDGTDAIEPALSAEREFQLLVLLDVERERALLYRSAAIFLFIVAFLLVRQVVLTRVL